MPEKWTTTSGDTTGAGGTFSPPSRAGGSGGPRSSHAPVLVGGGGDSLDYTITRTAPESLLRHDISDEELDVLIGDDSRPFEKDILWAAIGTAAGAIAPAIQAVHGLTSEMPNFGFWDLAECVIFACGAIVAIIMVILISRKPKKTGAADLAKSIRERTAKKVGTTAKEV
ncbi:hypothetical protein [Pseudohoeflea coraliihabitans]|uniref:Uncharacterized protein n=1 Tax=Pseudohoeflea coraliihabitans TaxID=2860393 RepID=A0ABS6WQ21_9HYPH|nr:hypothetical protein [Pseudohoeflea sp. DP4N28-3]MBW3098076.1 hypothetical protein [Pseudohoeflea sp. DP4N28-3]